MRYKMRAGASDVNGDKGRKGERRSESEGREGEVGKLKGGGEEKVLSIIIFVQVVVALCICKNIECLTG